MPSNEELLKVEDVSDVFCDALLTDAARVLFMSLWGRDTALQELLARLTLKSSDGGLRDLHIGGHYVDMSNSESLEKFSGRLPTSSLLGPVAHLWLYDPIVLAPDRANRRAVLLHRGSPGPEVDDHIWKLIRDLCHLPLLDTWREPVMAEFANNEWVRTLKGYAWSGLIKGHGLTGYAIDLSSPQIETFISNAVRTGGLSVPVDDRESHARVFAGAYV